MLVQQDGETTLDKTNAAAQSPDGRDLVPPEEIAAFLTVKSIWDYCTEELDPLHDPIDIIRSAVKVNTAISEEGLSKEYGLAIGRNLELNCRKGLMTRDLTTNAMIIASAGADARMAGAPVSVVANSGSGNQGITATMPVVAAARWLDIDEEKMLRAVTLSNLIAIRIKSKFGRLSNLCGATVAGTGAGYALIPHLSIDTEVAGLRELPGVVFELNIPQIMSVMSALVLSVLVGLAATWTNSKLTCDFLAEFQNIVLDIVSKIIIPILPFYIATTFCNLSYEGMITHQLPAFLQIIIIVMIGHYIWLTVLYLLAGAYSGKNPWEVLRHYGPAYLTAVGTMSIAATLAVALDCARKSKVLRKDMVSFGIPLFANIHLCGSVLTEVFFCMTISKILYGKLPGIGTMILFCLLLGIFAIGAPGVPGGTVMASLGLITGVLMFDDAGTALMLAIFALQDSFGTACNVTGDGALTLMLTGYAEKHGIQENQNIESPIL